MWLYVNVWQSTLNSLRLRRNGRYDADNIFKCIFLRENVCIPTKISLEFVPKGPINNIPALVLIMAWGRTGDRPLSEPTRTTRTPAFWGYPPPPHDYPYHWVILDPKSKDDKVKVTNFKNSPKFQIYRFLNVHYTRHTFWSCLIRCANMKWIRWVLLKIQSGQDSVHRRTDGQGDTSIPPYQLRWSGGYNDGLFTDTYMCHSASMSLITFSILNVIATWVVISYDTSVT